ncbi:unnamed protein product [Clonostachys rhizophaga]|uniref:Uncharacterized protein n=1 Tax=Clonostachys rhizophaga TaxID=160324 RepID=A0A9N9YUG8_9HYPO|nr:unnamed protein product [Clonostachys rhizophaga]
MATDDGVTANNARVIAASALSCLFDQNHDYPCPAAMADNAEAANVGAMAIDAATDNKGTVVDAEAIATASQAEPISTWDEVTYPAMIADREASGEVMGIDDKVTAPAIAAHDEAIPPGFGNTATAADAEVVAFNTAVADAMTTSANTEATTAEDTTEATYTRPSRVAKTKRLKTLCPRVVKLTRATRRGGERLLFPFSEATEGQMRNGRPGALVRWIPTPVSPSDAGNDKARASIQIASNQSLPTSSATYPTVEAPALAPANTNTSFSFEEVIQIRSEGKNVLLAQWHLTFVRLSDAGNLKAELLIREALSRDCPRWDTKHSKSGKH